MKTSHLALPPHHHPCPYYYHPPSGHPAVGVSCWPYLPPVKSGRTGRRMVGASSLRDEVPDPPLVVGRQWAQVPGVVEVPRVQAQLGEGQGLAQVPGVGLVPRVDRHRPAHPLAEPLPPRQPSLTLSTKISSQSNPLPLNITQFPNELFSLICVEIQ